MPDRPFSPRAPLTDGTTVGRVVPPSLRKAHRRRPAGSDRPSGSRPAAARPAPQEARHAR
ncbi:hypothetical protein SUDANB1_07547 [Streptomyces sp. enrichment culture]